MHRALWRQLVITAPRIPSGGQRKDFIRTFIQHCSQPTVTSSKAARKSGRNTLGATPMDTTDIYNNHSDIIYETTFRDPNYLVINLEKYLKRTFPDSQLFIPDFNLTDIRSSLQYKYGDHTHCFQVYGGQVDIACDKLKYYQPDVGISGPKHSESDEPVHVVNYRGVDILYNGYHRTLHNLVRGQRTIKAYHLTV